jgi:hypothetical protein
MGSISKTIPTNKQFNQDIFLFLWFKNYLNNKRTLGYSCFKSQK